MSRSVVIVDAVRTPFGKAGSLYAGTRADDLIVRAIRGLLERNPKVDPKTIDDVAIAAATQSGDQGMNIGRSAALLSGLPNSVPGYSIDRWCAGALTAVTTVAGSIARVPTMLQSLVVLNIWVITQWAKVWIQTRVI